VNVLRLLGEGFAFRFTSSMPFDEQFSLTYPFPAAARVMLTGPLPQITMTEDPGAA